MPKTTTTFVCRECGAESLRWPGQCPHCPAWNTLAEVDVKPAAARRRGEQARPAMAVVDCIETVYDPAVDSAPGSGAQVRGATARLMRTAKESGVPVVLVGHVTKEGAIAGPRVLEHMVDTVLYLEGERRL